MPPGLLLDKLKRVRRKGRLLEDDESSNDALPQRISTPRGMLRSLSAVANRTFHLPGLSSQRGEALGTRTLFSSDGANNSEYYHLADPPGPEASFIVADTLSPPIDVGACTKAGWHLVPDQSGSGHPLRARKPNQDSFDVQAPVLGNGLYVAVFDGHGGHGREASQLVRNIVPKLLRDYIMAYIQRPAKPGASDKRRCFARAFSRAFSDAEQYLQEEEHGVDHAFSGTTATCCWLDGLELFCAWVGDSRCVLARRKWTSGDSATSHQRDSKRDESTEYVVAVDLSWDQKPVRKDEKKRVRAAGGRVTRWQAGSGPQRVWLPEEWLPGLAMTRSIGDTILSKYGVVSQPELTVTKIGGLEEFYVLASDGVWEFMSSDEVVDFVWKQKSAGVGAEQASKNLVVEAVRRWTEREMVVDDTTAVVVYLDVGKGRTESIFGANVDDSKTRSLSIRLRRGKSVDRGEVRAGDPWLVAGNGKLESFMGDGRNEDDDSNLETENVNL